jgi:hypothetical protein
VSQSSEFTQQGAEPGTVPFGTTRVYNDYQNLADILARPGQKPYFDKIFAAIAGELTAAVWSGIAALDGDARTWLGYALYLYGKNMKKLPANFDHWAALNRLIAWAPNRTAMPGLPDLRFEREVLAVSGWTEAVVPAALTPPENDIRDKLTAIYNVAAEPGQQPDMTYSMPLAADQQRPPQTGELEGVSRVALPTQPAVLLIQPTALIADEPPPGPGGDTAAPGAPGRGQAGSSAPGGILTGTLYYAVKDDLLPKLAGVLVAEASYWREPDGQDLTAQPLAGLGGIANVIQRYLARSFQPYADGWPAGPGNNGFRYSDVLTDSQAVPAGEKDQLFYLYNRATLIGWKPEFGAPLATAGYDSRREDEQDTLRAVLREGLAASEQLRSDVSLLIKFTPMHTPSDGNVYIQTVFPSAAWNASPDRWAKWRWRTLRTLMHELLHKLAHQNYLAARERVRNDQVILEGFVDLLTAQLFTWLYRELKEPGNERLADALFQGIEGRCEPDERLFTVGYGQAGETAHAISELVPTENIQAAFFLGAVDLIGIRPPG